MTVAVLVPFRGGCPWRERAWAWVHARYEAQGYEVIVGTTAAKGFSRTQAILDARAQTSADVLVISDADVFCDGIPDAIDQVATHGWAVPHRLIHRLSEASTHRVLLGDDWRGQSLSQDNPQDRRPYKGHEAGTLLVTTADAFDTAPPDPRFTGWGSEDDAWSLTLRSLVGAPWRGDTDLVHCWHPAEPRQSRVVGNPHNARLLRRYRAARRSPQLMAELVEEGRTWTSPSSSTAPGSARR